MIPGYQNYNKAYNEVDTDATTTEREQIEPGVYPCQIMGVTLKETGSKKQYIECMLEITEGKYKNFFTKDYKAQKDDGWKKWRGCYNIFIPEQNDEEWKVKAFLREIKCVDVSNNTTFDGNEESLKGKKVACAFRREEYEYNGKRGFTTRPFKFVTIQDMKAGKLPKLDDKLLKNDGQPAPVQNARTLPVDVPAAQTTIEDGQISDAELPF